MGWNEVIDKYASDVIDDWVIVIQEYREKCDGGQQE